jgi:hypothetical protein
LGCNLLTTLGVAVAVAGRVIGNRFIGDGGVVRLVA